MTEQKIPKPVEAVPAAEASAAKPPEKPVEAVPVAVAPVAKPPEKPVEAVPAAKTSGNKILLFGNWDLGGVAVNDLGLKRYVNISPVVVPRSGGRYGTIQIQKDKINVVERFINRLMVPGHRGKKHKYTSGRCTASTNAIYLAVKEAFGIIEKKTKKNPVQVMVDAIENAAFLEEIASYRLGGIIARQSVIVSPQRRLDLALRYLTQGIYHSGFGKKGSLARNIAEELIAAAGKDPKSHAIRERNRIEKEAEGAR
ncbi:MAG: 30S ribosomal protein S7 [Candidatus Aenigmarchaeota archaeon]|nr:30S ribosomal protein S7 [Candidatus Aenigmarchaeota archaeon]